MQSRQLSKQTTSRPESFWRASPENRTTTFQRSTRERWRARVSLTSITNIPASKRSKRSSIAYKIFRAHNDAGETSQGVGLSRERWPGCAHGCAAETKACPRMAEGLLRTLRVLRRNAQSVVVMKRSHPRTQQ